MAPPTAVGTIPPNGARLPRAVYDASRSDEALAALSAANRDLRIERTAQGALIIMPPTGAETGHRNSQITAALTVWSNATKTGLSFDSNAGFRLPNGAVRSADASWVRRERWLALSADERRRFAPLCPDFVVELKSPTDALEDVQDKLVEFLANGAQLGWLIDPDARCVCMYRPGVDPEKLDRPSELHGDPVLPGFVLALDVIWDLE